MDGRGRSKSPAKVAAAQLNGQRGGRPVKHRYPEIFETVIGLPPEGDPLALATWAQRGAAYIAYETMVGRGNDQLNSQFKALANVIARLLPMERLAEAEKIIRAARAPARPTIRKGPEERPLDAQPAETSFSGRIRR